MAAAAGAPGNDDDGSPLRPRIMSTAEAERLWENLFVKYPEVAEELFIASMLQDARAERARRARDGEEEEEERQRRERVFRPWVPPPPGSALPPPPPAAAAPPVKRAVVLGLRAPPHLMARTHERTPSVAPAAGPGRPPEPKNLDAV